MRTIKSYFKDYGAYHVTKGNKLTHVFGIPIIVLAVLGMLDHIVFVPGNFWVHVSPALFLWAAVNIFYMRLHFWLGGSMLFTTGLLYAVGAQLSVPVNVALFVVGWVIQYYGHIVYEKKSPAFYKSLVHLLIGPLFIQNYVLRMV